jgi:aminoglycoside phosphotransferase (APT) family kinase protein
MRREWDPEVVVTPDLAARVIAVQWPELAHLPVCAFDAGWDNAVLAVGDDLLFRFIHRDIALDGSRRELAVLPFVAGRLPLPVPEPVFVGRPTDEVPWPFWGGPMLAGVGLAEAGVPADRRGAIARGLGGFLRALHALSTDPAPADEPALAAVRAALPVDPIRRNQPAFVAMRVVERLEALVAQAGAGSEVGRAAAAALRASAGLRARAAQLPAGPGRAVLHGDLHVRHVLVGAAPGAAAGADPGAEPVATGVIDWGDTQLGDPAVDLMVGWAAFEERERAAFLGAYGDVPPERAVHAQVLAIAVSASLALQTQADGHAAVLAEALDGLRRASGA